MYQKIFDKFKKSPFFTKILIILGLLGCYALLTIYVVYSVGVIVNRLTGKTGSPFYLATKDPFGQPLTVLVIAIMVFVLVYAIFNVNRLNRSTKSDSRGVHYMTKGTFGTSRWMEEDEIRKTFIVDNIKDTDTIIYGQLTENGEKVVGWKKKEKGGEGNKNTLLIAPMGAGKSYGYVRTEILQAIRRGNSFAVTDPSAELYKNMSQLCRDMGIKTYVLNLSEPEYSNCWNCLEEVINPDTERLDGTRLNLFAKVFMENTGGIVDFWEKSALNVIKTAIGYCSWLNEKIVLEEYTKIYRGIVNEELKDDDLFIKETKNEHYLVSFVWCREYIRNIAREKGADMEKLEEAFRLAKDKADAAEPFTIAHVYDYVLDFDRLVEPYFEATPPAIPLRHPAWDCYRNYRKNKKEDVKNSTQQETSLRFELFSDLNLRDMLSNPEIHINRINREQTALFLIMPVNADNPNHAIASLFFSFLFDDIQLIHNREQTIADEIGNRNPCIPVVALLDEFFSIGIIGSDEKVFAQTLSTSRKSEIYISVIIQSYGQLEENYGEIGKDIIQSGCSTTLFLGSNDPRTCDFISNFAGGEATVLDESHQALMNSISTNAVVPGYREKANKRQLITPDEARRWKDQVLVLKQGEHPVILNPFPWVEHPFAKMCTDKSVYTTISKISERTNRNYNGDSISASKISTTLNYICGTFYDDSKYNPETGEIIELNKKEVEMQPQAAEKVKLTDDDFVFVDYSNSKQNNLNLRKGNEPAQKTSSIDDD